MLEDLLSLPITGNDALPAPAIGGSRQQQMTGMPPCQSSAALDLHSLSFWVHLHNVCTNVWSRWTSLLCWVQEAPVLELRETGRLPELIIRRKAVLTGGHTKVYSLWQSHSLWQSSPLLKWVP